VAAAAAPAALMARKMAAAPNENVFVNDWLNANNSITAGSGYVQALAPQGALTYTSANLGI
jgi:fructoselysine-6-P-deglycase FrlB-like protein